MLKINVEKHIKRIVPVLVSFILIACDTSLTPNRWESDGYADLVFDMRLSRDTNGFYHLVLDRDNWQTLHRVSASVTENDKGIENFRIEWDASHYWFIGDTLGYAYKRGITDDFEYVLYDSTAITWFEGFEVPTINCCSYSNAEGEVNTMFAPIRTMKSDTVTVWMYFYNNIAEIHVDSFKVILE